jgi:hypothetical protein
MKRPFTRMLAAAIILTFTPIALAGHHYHGGHGSMVPSWDMMALDENQDGTLSFDEYSESQRKKLRAGFDMIDDNNDGLIDDGEWNMFLEAHGVNPK